MQPSLLSFQKTAVVEVREFWPISLVGVYKIIAKVLATQLHTVIGDIITASRMLLF